MKENLRIGILTSGGDGQSLSLPQDMCFQSPLQSKKLLTVLKLVDKPRSVIRSINDIIQASHK